MENKVPKYANPHQMDMLLQEPVHAMMETGIKIDKEKKLEFQVKQIEEWSKTQKELESVIGYKLNVSSSKQCQTLLYDKLGLPKQTKYDKKTESSKTKGDEKALRKIMVDCYEKASNLKTESARQRYMIGYIACMHILKIRGIRKQLSSYLGLHISKGKISGEAPLEDADGRIRGTISVGGTETARFSHSKTLWDSGVNLATVPKKLREMFIADEGYEIAEFDLNRGESWVYAHLSKDPELLRIHVNGLDFHSETAAALSGSFSGQPLSVEYIIKNKDGECFKLRFVSKKINHATSYRMKEYTCAESINDEAEDTGITVTNSQAKKAQDVWHQKYYMIKSNWWPEIENKLKEDRTLVTPYGRVHEFHGHFNDELFKSATAYIPQSTSVDYLNTGFLKVFYNYQKTGAWGLKILNQVHDSLLVQYKIEDRAEAIPAIREALTSSLTIKNRIFSIPVEAQYGPSWGILNGWKD